MANDTVQLQQLDENRASAGRFGRFLICGAVYARNLGDGVIAECMAHVLRSMSDDASIVFVDLSGRTNYSSVSIRGKETILKFLRIAPRAVGRVVLIGGIVKFLAQRAAPAWRSLFNDGDLVIIGGGHLLSDFNLNFPSKLALLTHYASRAGASVAIYGVGVSRHWTPTGTRLLKRVARSAATIAVRDEQSAAYLANHLTGLRRTISLTVDPGYLAKGVYGDARAPGRGVGLNVSDPAELSSYGGGASSLPDYDGFWIKLAKHYAAQGRPVSLFTNGADEDESYLKRIETMLGTDVGDRISIVPRATDPTVLVGTIKGLELLIGHRLHAHIVAFAYSIPSVALGWDEKIIAQLTLMGRSAFVIPFEAPDAAQTIALGSESEALPIDQKLRQQLEISARDGIISMITDADLRRLTARN